MNSKYSWQCENLNLRPLFIMRMAPRSYMYDLYKAGGFGLIFQKPFYPFNKKDFAKEVSEKLGLRVHCGMCQKVICCALKTGMIRKQRVTNSARQPVFRGLQDYIHKSIPYEGLCVNYFLIHRQSGVTQPPVN